MASTPTNVVPFIAHATPRGPAQARTWARWQLKRSLINYTAATAGAEPALAPAASAAFDVLAVAAAFLARAEPAQTADKLYWQLDSYYCDFTPDAVSEHTADNLAAILRPLIGEAMRALHLRRLARAQPGLISILHHALTAFIARDPDLHAVSVLAQYENLRSAIDAADPRCAVTALLNLHDLIRPAVATADVPLAAPSSEQTKWPINLVIEIQNRSIDDGASYATIIARLEALRAQLDLGSTWGAQCATWIDVRLGELRRQRRVACCGKG